MDALKATTAVKTPAPKAASHVTTTPKKAKHVQEKGLSTPKTPEMLCSCREEVLCQTILLVA